MDLFDQYFYNEDIEDMVPQDDGDIDFFGDDDDTDLAHQLGSLSLSTQSPKIADDPTSAEKIKVILSLSFCFNNLYLD